jgi:hypothetical protein
MLVDLPIFLLKWICGLAVQIHDLIDFDCYYYFDLILLPLIHFDTFGFKVLPPEFRLPNRSIERRIEDGLGFEGLRVILESSI